MAEDLRGDFMRIADQLAAAALSDEEVARRDAAVEVRRRLDRLESAGVPLPPADKRLVAHNRCQPTNAMRVVRAWHDVFTGVRQADDAPRLIVLLGATGRGKTMAGAWLVATEGGAYVSALELRKRLVSGHWRDGDFADRVLRSRVVVLDDVGTEIGDAEAAAAVFELVNKRMGLDGGLTLITGNITSDEFALRYGERTVRRIDHDGRFVEAKGDDLRRKPSH